MSIGARDWGSRSLLERKILVTAMEEGGVGELLLDSVRVGALGSYVDYPRFGEADARHALEGLILDGLVGTYSLDSDQEYVGEDAVASIDGGAAWNLPGSDGWCLFLTSAGRRTLGIHPELSASDSPPD